ncbi:hypothetical protein BD779DRAFT_1479996 [Infundibulicybe gibba]|nr:hypothetical protein BD779DRAFT_1479996 [Infundibulicybe gibba]
MGKIIGLLIPFTQMYEMASLHTSRTLVDVHDPSQQVHAFNICYTIAEKAGTRWVPVDYPAGSKQACIILPLYERDDTQPLRMKRWAASNWKTTLFINARHSSCDSMDLHLQGDYGMSSPQGMWGSVDV